MRRIGERSAMARNAEIRDRERFQRRVGRSRLDTWLGDVVSNDVPSWQRDRATLAFEEGIASVLAAVKAAKVAQGHAGDIMSADDLDQLIDRIVDKAAPKARAALRRKVRGQLAGLERKLRRRARPIHHRSAMKVWIDKWVSTFDKHAGARYAR